VAGDHNPGTVPAGFVVKFKIEEKINSRVDRTGVNSPLNKTMSNPTEDQLQRFAYDLYRSSGADGVLRGRTLVCQPHG
jgi:hypothetical protein